jgi:hypothetical protein
VDLAVWRRFKQAVRQRLTVPPWSSLREISMKILVNLSALVLSMILALIPFAVIAVNDSAAVKAEVIQGS